MSVGESKEEKGESEAASYLTSITQTTVPTNLPTAGEGLDFMQGDDESSELNDLENQAHAQRVLLSSDAMRYFVSRVENREERPTLLDRVLQGARTTFPNEDGWIVLNLARMESVLDEVLKSDVSEVNLAMMTSSSITAGSLAEAIVTGNMSAAYGMISHRPMVALADAVSDLDAVLRARRGDMVAISTLLKNETEKFSDEQLHSIISALNSVLDGAYTDEESAVKMAIMKALKEVG